MSIQIFLYSSRTVARAVVGKVFGSARETGGGPFGRSCLLPFPFPLSVRGMLQGHCEVPAGAHGGFVPPTGDLLAGLHDHLVGPWPPGPARAVTIWGGPPGGLHPLTAGGALRVPLLPEHGSEP